MDKSKRIMDCKSAIRDVFSDEKIIKMAKNGEIPHTKTDKGYFFSDAELDSWISLHVDDKLKKPQNNTEYSKVGPIDVDYRRLRLPSDLNKKTKNIISLKLIKYNNGSPIYPSDSDICEYLNKMASQNKIKHYRLSGEYGAVYLFDEDDICNISVNEVAPEKYPEVIKINCYTTPVSEDHNVPPEISSIGQLYMIPDPIICTGPCVYFLCRNSSVVYVGQTESNVYSRLLDHNKNKSFDSVFYIKTPVKRLHKIESALIAYLKPEYNQTNQSMSNDRELIVRDILQTV